VEGENRAGLLQVSPNSTYVGLTRSGGAVPGEPGKYHPTGRRTLARVVPADHIQARAGVVYAREMGVKRLGVVADETQYGQGLAKLVLSAARDVGLDVIDRGTGADLGKRAQSATAAGADAVYFAACSPPDEMFEFAGLHRGSKVFTGDCYGSLVNASPKELSPFDDRFFMTVPGGGLERTPAGRAWFERWRKRIGSPPDDELMFAYEAMLAVIDAIARAGDDGDDRAAVVREFFATRDRDSILGRYSIDRNGDTTLRSYGGFAIRDGKVRFDRVLDTGG
jgi:branched-chain amino acid transport system substrate-binding protein